MHRGGLPSNHIIAQRRRTEDARASHQEKVEYFAQAERKSEWEARSDARLQRNQIQSKVAALRAEDERALAARRQRLADLLAQDDEEHRAELEGRIEGPQDRVTRMRARAQALKAEREAERQAYVDQQLTRQFRAGQDALRGLQSKVMRRQVEADLAEQIERKEARAAAAAEEDARFSEAWEASRLAKIEREESDRAHAAALQADMISGLEEQIALKEARRRNEAEIKDEQRRLLEESWRLEEEEAARLVADKAKAVARRRQELDYYNHLAVSRKQAEVERERQEDLRIIEELIAEEAAKAADEAATRSRFQHEIRAYRDHLLVQMEKEREDDAMLDRMRQAQADEVMRQRDAQWAAEADARELLMQQVFEERERQIAIKMERNRREMFEAQREREEYNRQVEEAREEDLAERRRALEDRREYERALVAQIEVKEALKADAEAAEAAEYAAFRARELEYEERLRRELEREVETHDHRIRRTQFRHK